MRVLSKFTAAAALSAGLMLASAPAHAVVIAIQTGPFSLPVDPSGVIPAGTFAVGTHTYDFTFSTIGRTYSVLMQMQNTVVATGTPRSLDFTLFSGTPLGAHASIGSSNVGTAAALLQNLAPGNYYLELKTISAPRELVTGGITLFAVPEPATWAMLISGFGLLGLAGRRRRALAVA